MRGSQVKRRGEPTEKPPHFRLPFFVASSGAFFTVDGARLFDNRAGRERVDLLAFLCGLAVLHGGRLWFVGVKG